MIIDIIVLAKRVILAVLMIVLFYSISFGQTQGEMTKQSSEATKGAEKEIDSIYSAILILYSEDTLFIKNLKNSQSAWEKYYIAQIEAMFPDYPDQSTHYGSMKSMCVTEYARKLAEARINKLEKWLIGNEQGDCDSSVKPKKYLPEYTPYIPFDSSGNNDQGN